MNERASTGIQGLDAFYVFDSLTFLLQTWHSDLMNGNFFQVTCPYLYELNTIAYFALIRNAHTYDTIARIRETTQLLLDLYHIEGNYYVHPLKVWQRYSPTMFLPHLLKEQEAVSITASVEAAELFSNLSFQESKRDYWEEIVRDCAEARQKSEEIREEKKRLILPAPGWYGQFLHPVCMPYGRSRGVFGYCQPDGGMQIRRDSCGFY